MSNIRPLVLPLAYRGLSEQTYTCLKDLGWPMLPPLTGVADVALGRNILFERALQSDIEGDDFNVFLCVDDDMVFTPEEAKQVCQAALFLSHPVSAVYSLADRSAAASFLHEEKLDGSEDIAPWAHNRWLTGMGFMAIPKATLEKLADDSELISLTEDEDTQIHAFTWSGPGVDGHWYSEDTRLCQRLGGVILAPVGIGHVKPQVLTPDSGSLSKIAEGQLGFG